ARGRRAAGGHHPRGRHRAVPRAGGPARRRRRRRRDARGHLRARRAGRLPVRRAGRHLRVPVVPHHRPQLLEHRDVRGGGAGPGGAAHHARGARGAGAHHEGGHGRIPHEPQARPGRLRGGGAARPVGGRHRVRVRHARGRRDPRRVPRRLRRGPAARRRAHRRLPRQQPALHRRQGGLEHGRRQLHRHHRGEQPVARGQDRAVAVHRADAALRARRRGREPVGEPGHRARPGALRHRRGPAGGVRAAGAGHLPVHDVVAGRPRARRERRHAAGRGQADRVRQPDDGARAAAGRGHRRDDHDRQPAVRRGDRGRQDVAGGPRDGGRRVQQAARRPVTARTTSGAARTHAWFTPWVLVAPALVFLVAFNLWPAANVVFLAFTNVRVLSGGELVGLANFERMLTDDQLVTALVNSIVYMLVCVPFLLLVPLGLAVLVEKKLPGISFFRTAFYTPVVASAVVVALIWGWLLDDRGVVNAMAL